MTDISESAIISAELLATCGALGYFEDGTYLKEPDCLESLKDLIRYLRHDDEAHSIRRQLGEVNVLQTDLIPLLKYHGNDSALFDIILRLLVNLTNPVILLYHEELPEEKVTRNYYLQIASHLQTYKNAFIDSALWIVISNKLKSIFELDWTERQEEDKLIVERVLILLRNILHVPADPDDEKRTDDDVSIHDQVIWALYTTNVMDLLIYLAANEDEHEFSFHVLEIVFHILREQTPQQLADAGRSRSNTEKEKDIQELKMLRARELEMKKVQPKTPSRHPRFGGTFYIKNMKSISDRDVICHKPLAGIEASNFDSQKKLRRVAKNRLPMQDVVLHRRSTLSIRNCLKDFCNDLLNNVYNPFMATVKNQLTNRRAQDHDETYYLWAIRFFMEFNRLFEFDVARVSETVSVQTFHYVHTQLESYCDMMLTEKKKFHVWSKRIHIGLNAYHELLLTLGAMETSLDTKVQNSAKVLKGNIFYVVEYRDLLLQLLTSYDEVKFSKAYLKDLVLTTHTFMKMLEGYSKGHRTLIVQNKKKVNRRKSKNAAKKKGTGTASIELNEEQLEQLWDELADELSAALQSNDAMAVEIQPFDAVSEKTVDEQRADSVVKIQDSLRTKMLAEAVSLFRAAREIWPENNIFGTPNMEPNQEFTSLREIFFVNLPRPTASSPVENEDEAGGSGESDDERDEPQAKVSEQVFDFFDFLKRFASPKVVQPYILLLRQYEKNDSRTNRSLVRMMHRIAWDCKMYGLFYQASLFRVFQRILDDPARHTDPSIKELCRFAVFIIRKFFENAANNKKIFMEIMFWKNAREVYEIQEGYGSYEKKKVAKLLWTEEQEEELKLLYEQYKDVQEDGKDVVDLILEHMIDDTKNRRQVIKKLRVQALLAKDSKLPTSGRHKAVSSRPPAEWREEEIAELQTLFQQYKGATDIMGCIMDHVTLRRPKRRIIEKMLEMGIVKDRKELRKKRESKRKNSVGNSGGQEIGGGFDESASEDEDESDSDGDDVQVTETERPLDLPSLKEAFGDVLNSEFRRAIQWLKLALESAMEDREDEDDAQPTPLVPLIEIHQNAMQSSVFQNLLRIIGISPPASEQESFWRIPPSLSAAALRLRVQVITKAENGGFEDILNDPPLSVTGLSATNHINKPTTNKKRLHSSKTERRKPKRKKISDDDEIGELAASERREDEEESENTSDEQQYTEKNKHLLDSDDEAVRSGREEFVRRKTKRIRRIFEESDSETERNADVEDTSGEAAVTNDSGEDELLCSRLKRDANHSNSLNETTPQDDSDIDDVIGQSAKRIRKRIVVESDEEG